MFRAIYKMYFEIDLKNVNVVICRNIMVKLFDFVIMNSKNFEINVQIIEDKVVFIRKKRKITKFIDEDEEFKLLGPCLESSTA